MKLPVDYDGLSTGARRAVREEYVRLQGGLCYHCHEPLTGDPVAVVKNTTINAALFPDHFFNYPVHLHHSHETGKTLGAVHARCNAFLWQYLGE